MDCMDCMDGMDALSRMPTPQRHEDLHLSILSIPVHLVHSVQTPSLNALFKLKGLLPRIFPHDAGLVIGYNQQYALPSGEGQ